MWLLSVETAFELAQASKLPHAEATFLSYMPKTADTVRFCCNPNNVIVAPSSLGGADNLQAMAEVGMPLLIHGEVTTAGVDIFDKEARFIEEVIKVSTIVTTGSGHKTPFLTHLL